MEFFPRHRDVAVAITTRDGSIRDFSLLSVRLLELPAARKWRRKFLRRHTSRKPRKTRGGSARAASFRRARRYGNGERRSCVIKSTENNVKYVSQTGVPNVHVAARLCRSSFGYSSGLTSPYLQDKARL